VAERPPDPFRAGEVPGGSSAGRNVAVVLGVALLVLLAVVVVWAIAR
jgi:Asp-tRNA(Asn)/Glu-tRNA(Gln) amidotransferase A subunit family amidase